VGAPSDRGARRARRGRNSSRTLSAAEGKGVSERREKARGGGRAQGGIQLAEATHVSAHADAPARAAGIHALAASHAVANRPRHVGGLTMVGARCVARQSREADNRWPRSGMKSAEAHIAHTTKPALHPASSALAQTRGFVAAIRQGARWRRSDGRPRLGSPRAVKSQHGLHIPMHRMARVSRACTVAMKPWEVGAAEAACGPMGKRRWWWRPRTL
jgi:hypothetical protein